MEFPPAEKHHVRPAPSSASSAPRGPSCEAPDCASRGLCPRAAAAPESSADRDLAELSMRHAPPKSEQHAFW
eukprot:scaffold1178_cov252-Pinguiococcus_pyrenoidosus.AAC.30